jgi:hypothetical protein
LFECGDTLPAKKADFNSRHDGTAVGKIKGLALRLFRCNQYALQAAADLAYRNC